MENAGKCISEKVLKLDKNRRREIGIFWGKGNNVEDGFVSARYLFNRDFKVEIYYFGEKEKFSEITRINVKILKNLGVKFFLLQMSLKIS